MKIRLIPAIDLINGQCVRLSQGDYKQQTTYDSDPLAVARRFESAGITNLHLVDLDGAKQGKVVNWKVLESICKNTSLQVDFGGGLRTTDEAQKAFDLGAKQITGGSIAVKQPEVFQSWLKKFGGERIILGLDLKDGCVATHGWEQVSSRTWQDFLAFYIEKGVQYAICTDINRDGMLSGPAIGLYDEIQKAYPALKLIASGGVANMKDIIALDALKMDAVIFGKAFYEGNISLEDLRNVDFSR